MKDPLSDWNFAIKDDSIQSKHDPHQINSSITNENRNTKSMIKLLSDQD